MDNIKQYKRRIGFLRADEREAEAKKARVADHVRICNEFADEIANWLYIQSPETSILVIDNIKKYLNGLLENNE